MSKSKLPKSRFSLLEGALENARKIIAIGEFTEIFEVENARFQVAINEDREVCVACKQGARDNYFYKISQDKIFKEVERDSFVELQESNSKTLLPLNALLKRALANYYKKQPQFLANKVVELLEDSRAEKGGQAAEPVDEKFSPVHEFSGLFVQNLVAEGDEGYCLVGFDRGFKTPSPTCVSSVADVGKGMLAAIEEGDEPSRTPSPNGVAKSAGSSSRNLG